MQEKSYQRRTVPVTGQGRIITETLEKLKMADKEQDALKRLHESKNEDNSKIHFKYMKARSEFLGIMHDLSQFRSKFF